MVRRTEDKSTEAIYSRKELNHSNTSIDNSVTCNVNHQLILQFNILRKMAVANGS